MRNSKSGKMLLTAIFREAQQIYRDIAKTAVELWETSGGK